jgi:hypothetical protein
MDRDEIRREIIRRRHQLSHQMVLIITMIQVVITATLLIAGPHYDKTPYHTSALTGVQWVCELLEGHPERIRNELGVHKHVFAQLIEELQKAGYNSSRCVTLDEQLAIFLYTSVTGLSIRHVGERFQRATDTVSRYVPAISFGLVLT